MTKNEAIQQLLSLIDDAETHFTDDGDDEVFRRDVEALRMAIHALREYNPKPLTLDEIQKMAGQPVWCAELECYGIIKLETGGAYKNRPYLVGAWHHNGVAVNFEHDLAARGYTLYRRKPEDVADK